MMEYHNILYADQFMTVDYFLIAFQSGLDLPVRGSEVEVGE